MGGARGEPLEGLEQAVDLGWRDDRPRVGHRQDGVTAAGSGGDLDIPPFDVVPDGVVDQADPGGLSSLPASAAGRRPEYLTAPASDSARAEAGTPWVAEVLPVHARPRRAELPRPHTDRPEPPGFRHHPCVTAVPGRGAGLSSGGSRRDAYIGKHEGGMTGYVSRGREVAYAFRLVAPLAPARVLDGRDHGFV